MRCLTRSPERLVSRIGSGTKAAKGDVLDWWRVESYASDGKLLLNAEMKTPGRAWLEFGVSGDETGSEIRQTALFDPVGLCGLIYWYLLYPVHNVMFAGMLRRIAAASVEEQNRRNAEGRIEVPCN